METAFSWGRCSYYTRRVKDIKAVLPGNEGHGSSSPDVLYQNSLFPQDPFPPRFMNEYHELKPCDSPCDKLVREPGKG